MRHDIPGSRLDVHQVLDIVPLDDASRAFLDPQLDPNMDGDGLDVRLVLSELCGLYRDVSMFGVNIHR